MFVSKFLLFLTLDCLICLTSLEDSDAAPIFLNAKDERLKADLDHDLQFQLKNKTMHLFPQMPPDPETNVTQKPQPRIINALPPSTALVNFPKFIKDRDGNWEFYAWGRTFGHMWKDRRFNAHFTVNRIPVDSNPVIDYSEKVWTRCKSVTNEFHNALKVKSWLSPRTYNHEIKRPIWNTLRRMIYNVGESEQCHRLYSAKNTFYINKTCSVVRNMRLESLIPRYPLHQLGRRKLPKN